MLHVRPEPLNGVQGAGVGRQEEDLEGIGVYGIQFLGIVDPEVVEDHEHPHSLALRLEPDQEVLEVLGSVALTDDAVVDQASVLADSSNHSHRGPPATHLCSFIPVLSQELVLFCQRWKDVSSM